MRVEVDSISYEVDIPPGSDPLPVSAPRTGLLRGSWKFYGLIDPWERPGPLVAAAA